MAVASLRDVMDALRDQIEDALSAATVDVQVGSRMIVAPSPPTIDMYPSDPSSDPESAAMADAQGGDLLTVRARVDTNDHEANQDILVDFMDRFSDLSVAQAIVDDPYLGGLARLDVQSSTGLRQYIDPDGSGGFLGGEWTVLVLRIES